jgi:hypothetical protein
MVLRGAEHAGGGIGFLRVVRGLRQDDFFAVEMRLLRVHDAVERRVFLARDALAGVEDRVKGLARMVGEARTLVQRLGAQPVVKQEVERGPKAHDGLPGTRQGARAGNACPF